MRRLPMSFAVATLSLLAITGTAAAKPAPAPAYTLVASAPGTATLVPGENGASAVQLTSSTSGSTLGWSAIGFAVPKGMVLSDVTNLSTDYDFTLGSCWQGAPRFTIGLSYKGTKEIYFYIGPQPGQTTGCVFDQWESTGPLTSANSLVDDQHLPGGSPTDTFANAVSKYGSYSIKYIAIDLDGGGGGAQAVLIDNTNVDGAVYGY